MSYRSIKTNQRLERELAFLLTGTGTAELTVGSDLATLVDNGTGNYTITFNRAFARQPIALCQAGTDVQTVRVVTLSTTALNIEITGADQTTPGDGIAHILVKGWDTADEFGENL